MIYKIFSFSDTVPRLQRGVNGFECNSPTHLYTEFNNTIKISVSINLRYTRAKPTTPRFR